MTGDRPTNGKYVIVNDAYQFAMGGLIKGTDGSADSLAAIRGIRGEDGTYDLGNGARIFDITYVDDTYFTIPRTPQILPVRS